MYRKQFLLTKREDFRLDWEKVPVRDYCLYYHPNLKYSFAGNDDVKLYLLGSLYDWEEPQMTDQHILSRLLSSAGIDDLLVDISKFGGRYVLIYDRDDNIIVFNDACAQSEIYYDTDFTCIGTQPKLLAEVVDHIPHRDPLAIEFYSSSHFHSKFLFASNSTHLNNIKHLLPNHCINLTRKIVKRFFPVTSISELSLDEVAAKAALIITGYVKAISLRNKMAMAVTGGYDSRVLFLASLDSNCKYFVSKHTNMKSSHYDISIPKELTAFFNKEFSVIPDSPIKKDDYDDDYKNCVDFPRYLNIPDVGIADCVLINGNISEVARNYFGYSKNITSRELSYLNGFASFQYPSKLYEAWIKSSESIFESTGYNILDMFYWEEKMGNWAAKTKTEYQSLGIDLISPFNSRYLLTLLLSVKRKYRDSHFNKLYDRIIFHLSRNDSRVLSLPINPSRKQNTIRLMKRLKLYNTYRFIGLKTRKLQL